MDWYSGTYYPGSPFDNPLGPDTGQHRVVRGSAWDNSGSILHAAYRHRFDPTSADYYRGFRCSRSP